MMKTFSFSTHQKGSTLMSTIIGLTLGMVCILAMLSLMTTMSRLNVSLSTSAKTDGSIASGFLGAQIRLQSAGYGIENATTSCYGAQNGPAGTLNTDFILISGASYSTTTSLLSGTATSIPSSGTVARGNALIWRFIDDGGTSQCEGLLATNGGLQSLTAQACTNTSSWGSLTWTTAPLVSNSTILSFPADPLDNANPFSQTNFFKASKTTSCSPYGMSTGTPGVLIRFGANQSFSGGSTIPSLCLPNICQ